MQNTCYHDTGDVASCRAVLEMQKRLEWGKRERYGVTTPGAMAPTPHTTIDVLQER